MVGMTSVGSGSIIMMMLLLLFCGFPSKVMVGTDTLHAVTLTCVTSLMHWRIGNIDFRLVAALVALALHSLKTTLALSHQ